MMRRYAMAIVVTVEAESADAAFEIISNADMSARDNPSTVIEMEYGTNAAPCSPQHDSSNTSWEIPELLWGAGKINVLSLHDWLVKGP
jgi:hypothetical protein